MAIYKDSLGNSYLRLPPKKPNPSAKSTTETSMRRSGRRKTGKKVNKHALYRQRVGKPNGPGQPGTKSGRNKIKR